MVVVVCWWCWGCSSSGCVSGSGCGACCWGTAGGSGSVGGGCGNVGVGGFGSGCGYGIFMWWW